MYSESSKFVWVLSFHLRCVMSVRLTGVIYSLFLLWKRITKIGAWRRSMDRTCPIVQSETKGCFKSAVIWSILTCLKPKLVSHFSTYFFFFQKNSHASMASVWITCEEEIAIVQCILLYIILWNLNIPWWLNSCWIVDTSHLRINNLNELIN